MRGDLGPLLVLQLGDLLLDVLLNLLDSLLQLVILFRVSDDP